MPAKGAEQRSPWAHQTWNVGHERGPYVASRVDEDGVLILSSFAGASRELTDAIVVNPFSEEEGVNAILQALEMPPEERRKRMQKMRAVTAENNIYRWAGKIISALLKFEFPAAVESPG
jgi:trehalose-6-phosphate synthase